MASGRNSISLTPYKIRALCYILQINNCTGDGKDEGWRGDTLQGKTHSRYACKTSWGKSRSYFYVPSSAQKEPVLSTTKTFIKLKKLLDISFSIACYLIAKLKNFFDPQLITCPLIKNPRCFSGGPLIINPSTIYHHS